MPVSTLFICFGVAVADGDTLATCGEPGSYEQVKVRVAGIDAPEKAHPFGQRSRIALADLCDRDTANIRSTTRNKYGRTVADVECQG
jgi:endonuclease YncB( thermonuclease family)